MSGLGFAPPDLCSIRTAAGQEGLAEAVRGGFSAHGYPPGDDDPLVPLTSGIDWESRRPSWRTWPRAGPTVPSGGGRGPASGQSGGLL
jgi:hypothetical protein